MKTLLVMRHAKSSWKGESLADFDRPLKGRGKRDASRMGAFLRDQNLVPELIISSAAKRARSTAAGFDGELRRRDDLYTASPEGYIEMLHDLGYEEADDEAVSARPLSRVLVIGHNPVLEQLVFDLSGASVEMPTGAIAVVDLEIERWDELDRRATGTATLRARHSPRDLPREEQSGGDLLT